MPRSHSPLRYTALLALAALTLIPFLPGRAATAPDVPPLDEHPGLVYARYGDRELQLDLYRPKASSAVTPTTAAAPLPAIVCIHGGGWQKGARTEMTNLARALARRGFVTVSISYRLSGEAPFPAQIQDAKAAVRWLRANAQKFGIAADRIGAIGHSAGGHLAALLATSGGVREFEGDGGHAGFDSHIQAAVGGGTQTDLTAEHVRTKSAEPGGIYPKFLGASYAQRPAAYSAASPLHHLDKTDPPLAFFTGGKDQPSTHAVEMRAQLTNLGIPTALTVVPDAPHAFLGKPQWFEQIVTTSAEFFTAHLAGPSRSQ